MKLCEVRIRLEDIQQIEGELEWLFEVISQSTADRSEEGLMF